MLGNILSSIIPVAYADTPAAAAPQQSSLSFVLMFAVFFLFMYFAIWRPQNKRDREQRQMLGSLAKGDEVMMAGGLLGRIVKMSDTYLTLAIANNVEVVMQRSSVTSVLPKGTLKSLE